MQFRLAADKYCVTGFQYGSKQTGSLRRSDCPFAEILIAPKVGVVGVVLPPGRVDGHRRGMHRVAVGERHPALVVDIADGAVNIRAVLERLSRTEGAGSGLQPIQIVVSESPLATKRGFDARSQ